MANQQNPKILYISDVPVTNLYSGSAMMYNLLENFKQDELFIYQGIKLAPEHQLRNIGYDYQQPVFSRLKYTRFARFFRLANIFYNYFFVSPQLNKVIREFKPDAIITVVHGLLWVNAYRVARRKRIPLAICIHDDINAHYHTNTIEGKRLRNIFKQAYKYAYARFCISDLMRQEYKTEMAVDGTTVWPLQKKNIIVHDISNNNSSDAITVAYAGTLEMPEYIHMLNELAVSLAKYGSELLLFSASFPDILQKNKNVIYGGFVKPGDVAGLLAVKADVLFVPFSFEGIENKTQLAFPSKLAEYTTLSKPLLVWASAGSAIGKWFSGLSKIPGIMITEKNDTNALDAAVKQLLDPVTRNGFAKQAVLCGQEYFGYNEVQQKFISILKEIPLKRA